MRPSLLLLLPLALACPPGQYLLNSLCTTCPPGSVLSSNSSACTPCPPWTLSIYGQCAACPADTYCADGLSSPCLPGHCNVSSCSLGYTGHACSLCSPAYYATAFTLLDGSLAAQCASCSSQTGLDGLPLSSIFTVALPVLLVLLTLCCLFSCVVACFWRYFRHVLRRAHSYTVHPVTALVVLSQVQHLNMLWNVKGVPFPGLFRSNFLGTASAVGLNFDAFGFSYAQCWELTWNLLWTWLLLLLLLLCLLALACAVILCYSRQLPHGWARVSLFYLYPTLLNLLLLQVYQKSLQLLPTVTIDGSAYLAYDVTVPVFGWAGGLNHTACYATAIVCIVLAWVVGLEQKLLLSFAKRAANELVKGGAPALQGMHPAHKHTSARQAFFLCDIHSRTSRHPTPLPGSLFSQPLGNVEFVNNALVFFTSLSVLFGPYNTVGTTSYLLLFFLAEAALAVYFFWQGHAHSGEAEDPAVAFTYLLFQASSVATMLVGFVCALTPSLQASSALAWALVALNALVFVCALGMSIGFRRPLSRAFVSQDLQKGAHIHTVSKGRPGVSPPSTAYTTAEGLSRLVLAESHQDRVAFGAQLVSFKVGSAERTAELWRPQVFMEFHEDPTAERSCRCSKEGCSSAAEYGDLPAPPTECTLDTRVVCLGGVTSPMYCQQHRHEGSTRLLGAPFPVFYDTLQDHGRQGVPLTYNGLSLTGDGRLAMRYPRREARREEEGDASKLPLEGRSLHTPYVYAPSPLLGIQEDQPLWSLQGPVDDHSLYLAKVVDVWEGECQVVYTDSAGRPCTAGSPAEPVRAVFLQDQLLFLSAGSTGEPVRAVFLQGQLQLQLLATEGKDAIYQGI